MRMEMECVAYINSISAQNARIIREHVISATSELRNAQNYFRWNIFIIGFYMVFHGIYDITRRRVNIISEIKFTQHYSTAQVYLSTILVCCHLMESMDTII